MRTARSSSRPGGLHQAPHGTRHLPGTRHPPGPGTPQDQAPLLWTEWQTGVNILPCPKLCLRAVNISKLCHIVFAPTNPKLTSTLTLILTLCWPFANDLEPTKTRDNLTYWTYTCSVWNNKLMFRYDMGIAWSFSSFHLNQNML